MIQLFVQTLSYSQLLTAVYCKKAIATRSSVMQKGVARVCVLPTFLFSFVIFSRQTIHNALCRMRFVKKDKIEIKWLTQAEIIVLNDCCCQHFNFLPKRSTFLSHFSTRRNMRDMLSLVNLQCFTMLLFFVVLIFTQSTWESMSRHRCTFFMCLTDSTIYE